MSTEATERAARALRTALVLTAGASLALGALAAAIALLAGPERMWPGLSLLAGAQLTGLVAAAAAALGLRQLLAGAPAPVVTARVRRRLRVLRTVLAVLLIAGVAVWVAVRPTAVVAVVASALVSAQLAVVLHLLQR